MRDSLGLDASLGSIILIVLISSALVVFTLAQEEVESPVTILKNQYPSRIYSQASVTTREKMDFSFSVAARKKLARLGIQYVTLVETDPVPGPLNPSSSWEGILGNISALKALTKESGNPYLETEVRSIEVEHGNWSYEGVFYDFPVVRFYASPECSDQVLTSFLMLKNETHVLYFEGISDFYIHRLGRYYGISLPQEERNRSSIDRMKIRRNQEVATYSSAQDAPPGALPITEVPEKGRVVFDDLEEHDTISIDFTIEIPRRPSGLSAHLIRIYADGQPVEMRLNLVE